MPAALAAMIQDRQADASAAAEEACRARPRPLAPAAWRRSVPGVRPWISAELLGRGTVLRLVARLPVVVEAG
jgi:hypothetical protein